MEVRQLNSIFGKGKAVCMGIHRKEYVVKVLRMWTHYE